MLGTEGNSYILYIDASRHSASNRSKRVNNMILYGGPNNPHHHPSPPPSTLWWMSESSVLSTGLGAKPTSIFSVTFTSLPDTALGQSISSGVSRPTTHSPGFIWELELHEFISAIAAEGLRNSTRHYLSQTTDLCSKEAALWSHMTKWNFLRYMK